MSEYINQEHKRLEEISQEIIDLQRAKMQVLQNHDVTINTLQEYEK